MIIRPTGNGAHVVGSLLIAAVLALAIAGTAAAAKPGTGGGGGGGGGKGGGKGGGGQTPATRVEGAGDSIMQGYNASCTRNTGLFDFLCYGGGDQPQNSFLDGSNSAVVSLVDRYLTIDGATTGGKAAAASGSEMTDPNKNNFAQQAKAIVASATQPVKVKVELGGNDLCNRTSIANLYTDAQWTAAVRAGLDELVNKLPDGSTVLLTSVPRVQDLRAVGLAKESSRIDCDSFWASFDVCRIATDGGTFGGADLPTRLAALAERQKRYNEILQQEAAAYNANAVSTGVEVIAEYAGESVASAGTYRFQPTEINGGDCFHPSLAGQNKLSEIIWGRLQTLAR